MHRILLIHAAGGIGGGTASLIDLLYMLAPHFEVSVVLPKAPPDAAKLVSSRGFPVVQTDLPFPALHAYNGAPGISSRQLWRGIAHGPHLYREWSELISAQAPDIVVTNSSVLAPLGPAIRKTGAKSVCVVRETIPTAGTRARLLNYQLAKWFDGLVYISEFDMDRAPTVNGKSRIVVRDCVRPAAFRRLPRQEACDALALDPRAYNVLYTGGHSWLKGLDVALEAISIARIEEVRLVVAGGGYACEPAAKTRIKRAVRSKTVAFDDRVSAMNRDRFVRSHTDYVGSQSDMSACYSAADLVIFPATLAHQSRPLLEAAYYGLPALCSDFPQFQEHSPALHTFRPGDPAAMATELARLGSDRSMGARSGLINQAYCSATHDFSQEGERLTGFMTGFFAG